MAVASTPNTPSKSNIRNSVVLDFTEFVSKLSLILRNISDTLSEASAFSDPVVPDSEVWCEEERLVSIMDVWLLALCFDADRFGE